MSQLMLYAADALAILLLSLATYFPRHRRKDLAVAFIAVNIGVLAVSAILSASTLGAGVGLGLFGVLSIIRLRSAELSHTEVGYYFSALALGLLAGLGQPLGWRTLALMGGIVAVMVVADAPRLLSGYHRQEVVLDTAIADPAIARARLESMLGARVYGVSIERLDTVNDTTVVEVRYRADPRRREATTSHRTTQYRHLAATGAHR